MNTNQHIRDLVVALYRNNKSYTQIGVELGITRGAAAGHINRAKVLGEDFTSRQNVHALEAVARRLAARAGKTRKSPSKVLPPTPPSMDAPAPLEELCKAPTGSLAILGLKSTGSCCWPIGDPKASDFRYCCEPCFGTYCVKHSKEAYIPRSEIKKRGSHARVRIPIPAFR